MVTGDINHVLCQIHKKRQHLGPIASAFGRYAAQTHNHQLGYHICASLLKQQQYLHNQSCTQIESHTKDLPIFHGRDDIPVFCRRHVPNPVVRAGLERRRRQERDAGYHWSCGVVIYVQHFCCKTVHDDQLIKYSYKMTRAVERRRCQKCRILSYFM